LCGEGSWYERELLVSCCVYRSSLPQLTLGPSRLRDSTAMASSLSGHKRRHEEQEIDPNCTCVVCFEVLLDPVTLPCGHTIDQRCLQRMVAAGGSVCPTCRKVLPAVDFSVNVLLRDLMLRDYPEQVTANLTRCCGGRGRRRG
jgi:hypothetical protein